MESKGLHSKNILKLKAAIQDNCVYYSGFLIDTDISKRATLESALKTYVLPIDFHLNESEFLKQKKLLYSLGIETLDVFSGHGYQSLILLKEEAEDKLIYKKFTSMLMNKGFKVDASIKDCARLLRLPYTINNEHKPINTYIANDTDKRYFLEDVFRLLETLPDTIINVEIDGLDYLDINAAFNKLYGKYDKINLPEHVKKCSYALNLNIEIIRLYFYLSF